MESNFISFFHIADLWDAIVIIIGSSLVSTVINIYFGHRQENKRKEEERYEKLYGKMTYHLLYMKVISKNREDLTGEIVRVIKDVDYKNQSLIKHINPLVLNWINHKDSLKKAIDDHPGYIKKEHIKLIEDFIDGLVKREIIEEGKNIYANEGRINKLLNAIKALQDNLLN